MISTIVSRLVILVFGTLYPAYASYKAVRTKNVKEYVKWMMYWIVFALFTCAETFTDVFLSWFPFYYEIKIILVLWLLSPATKGSSILYRKFVHPMLSRREQEIDDYIAKAKEQGYHTVLNLGTKGVNYATTVIMQTAIKGGGGLVNQLRKSYSLSDLTADSDARAETRGLQQRLDEADDVVDARLVRRRRSPHRSSSGSSRVDIFFPEMDVRPGPSLGHVRSIEDVSSGYSSAEPLYVGQPAKLEAREGLIRTASVGGGSSRLRARTTRTGLSTKKITLPEDSECSEDTETDVKSAGVHRISKINQKKSNRVSASQKGSGSSDSSSEFVDCVEFPPENIPVKSKEAIEKTPGPSKTEVRTLDICNVEIETREESVQETIIDSSEETVVDIEKVSEITNTVVKIEEVSVQTQTDAVNDVIIEKHKIQEVCQMDNTVVDEGNTQIESLIPVEQDVEVDKEEIIDTVMKEELLTNDGKENLTVETASISSQRGGRYNKAAAPIPPEPTVLTPKIDPVSHPIKATLVLKPGIIKSISPVTEDSSPSEVFVSHSPKPKRKSNPQIKSKHESPISRLMMLPKKLLGHKDNKNLKQTMETESKSREKRKSWHVDTQFLIPHDKQSKSDTEGPREELVSLKDDRRATSTTDIDKFVKLKHEENTLILRNLSHSPKQYQRKNKRGSDDYEDSD